MSTNRFILGFAGGVLLSVITVTGIFMFSDAFSAEEEHTPLPPTITISASPQSVISPSPEPNQEQDRQTYSSQANEETVMLLVEDVMNDKNTEIVSDIFAEDYIGHLPPSATWSQMTIDTYRELPILLHGAIPDIRVTPEILFIEDNWLALRAVLSGTFRGELYDISPTQSAINIAFTVIYRFNDDGKIAEEWITYDTLAFSQQFSLE